MKTWGFRFQNPGFRNLRQQKGGKRPKRQIAAISRMYRQPPPPPPNQAPLKSLTRPDFWVLFQSFLVVMFDCRRPNLAQNSQMSPRNRLFRRDAGFFAYNWKLPAYGGAFYLQLTILAFSLTVGAFLLTDLAFLLTVGAFLLTVGKCV